MNTDTYIFGYTDADGQDEIVLCPLCGGEFFKACPKEWAILRTEHAAKYPGGRKCDKCDAQVYFPSISDALASRHMSRNKCSHSHTEPEGEHSTKFIRCVDCGTRLPTHEPHRLEVYAEFVETLEF